MKHIATFLYGSQVYGTADKNSDIDYIVVVERVDEEGKQTLTDDVSITYYSRNYFQKLLDDHDVMAVECFFLPESLKLGRWRGFRFELDRAKLRRSFSKVASNSWVKAKKKIDKEKEYHIGRKSLYHSLRILWFGIRLAMASHWSIPKPMIESSYPHWFTIKKQNFETWAEYKEYWQRIYNGYKSQFRKVAPLEEDS